MDKGFPCRLPQDDALWTVVQTETVYRAMETPLSSLNGHLYRVGPCPVRRNGSAPKHAFDGDGLIEKVTLKEGKVVETKRRLIATPQFLAEEQADQFLYRGAFGTAPHKSLRTLKNPLNTALAVFRNDMYALWEGGLPAIIDKESLDFVRFANFAVDDSSVASHYPFSLGMGNIIDTAFGLGGEAWCAHPVRDARNNVFITLACSYTLNETKLTFRELDETTGVVVRTHEVKLAGFVHVHSFAVDDDDIVFFAPFLDFAFWPWARGRSLLECVTQKPGCSRVVRVDRNLGMTYEFMCSHLYATHVVKFDSFKNTLWFTAADSLSCRAPRFYMCRGTFDEGSNCLSVEVIDADAEFPVACPNGRFIAYAASVTGGFMNAWKVLDTWTGAKRTCNTPRAHMHGEPVWLDDLTFVGVTLSEDGTHVTTVSAAGRQVATQPVPGLNPLGLHCLFLN